MFHFIEVHAERGLYTNVTIFKIGRLMPVSHRRHGQDKTRQDSFVLSVSAV